MVQQSASHGLESAQAGCEIRLTAVYRLKRQERGRNTLNVKAVKSASTQTKVFRLPKYLKRCRETRMDSILTIKLHQVEGSGDAWSAKCKRA